MKVSVPVTAEVTSFGSSAAWVGQPNELNEQQWASLCLARLSELRPSAEPGKLRAAVADLASSLRYFDPVLAAEMEHEGGMLDD